MVIDSSDRERLDELYCDVLKPALHADELANSVFLFLVNKRDLPNTLNKDEVAARLNLQSVKHIWSEFIVLYYKNNVFNNVKNICFWLVYVDYMQSVGSSVFAC